VDLFAPGQEIRSAHNATDRATRVLRGTSMAAPHVTGAALVLSVYSDATPAQVAQLITNSATVGALRADTIGAGSPNKLLYSSDPVNWFSSGTQRPGRTPPLAG
jgi:subtilisin family serine protease